MAGIAPDVPLVTVRTMRERLGDNTYIDRLLTTLPTGFAALATLLAGIGLYGVRCAVNLGGGKMDACNGGAACGNSTGLG